MIEKAYDYSRSYPDGEGWLDSCVDAYRVDCAEDLEKMRESMNSILTHMEELNQHDTYGVEPTAHAVEQYNVMREDEPHQSLSNEEALFNAPEKEGGYFKVPKII